MIFAAMAIALCPAQGVRITCVHDGDSFIVERERIRIENIDTPELNGKCEAERARAVTSRNALLDLLNGGEVSIRRSGQDRHGRTLARVTVNGADVGDALIRSGHARRWTGRREPWC